MGGGQLFSGAWSTNGRVCTDYGGIKVVDIGNPDNPSVTNTIRVEDPAGAATGPTGNRRRGLKIDNVSSSVSAVDAISHGPAGKDILAFATQRCEQSFFSGGGQIEFWDVSNPAAPSRVGVWTGPPGKAWGIFEDLRMFTRADKPGKVYAVATTPFSSNNSHNSTTEGEFRLLDITDPANPVQIGGFPTENIGSNSNNGCRIFYEGRSAAPTPGGKHAILSYYDGAPGNPLLPNSTADIPSSLGGPNTAALFNLDLDNLPVFVPGSDPPAYSPNPPSWGYSLAQDGGLTPTGQIAEEGNAADVQPFTGPNGELLTWVSEDDFDPATTSVTIDAPGPAVTRRGCEFCLYQLNPPQTANVPCLQRGKAWPDRTLANGLEVVPQTSDTS